MNHETAQVLGSIIGTLAGLGILFAMWTWYGFHRLREQLEAADERATRAMKAAYAAEESIRTIAHEAGLEWQPPAPGAWRKR